MRRSPWRWVDATRSPELAAGLLAAADSVVSHSYHLALWALEAGTPAVLVTGSAYYEAKAAGLARLAGLTGPIALPASVDATMLGAFHEPITAELDTDMTSRGFGTEAAQRFLGGGNLTRVTPLSVGIDALERGINRRSRIICAPRYVAPILPIRMLAQPAFELVVRGRLAEVLDIARGEVVDLTTPQPGRTR